MEKKERTVTVWLQDTKFTSWGRQNTYSRWDTGAVFIGARGARNGHAGGGCRQRDARRPRNLLASGGGQQGLDTAHPSWYFCVWQTRQGGCRPPGHARERLAPTLRPPRPRSETKTGPEMANPAPSARLGRAFGRGLCFSLSLFVPLMLFRWLFPSRFAALTPTLIFFQLQPRLLTIALFRKKNKIK